MWAVFSQSKDWKVETTNGMNHYVYITLFMLVSVSSILYKWQQMHNAFVCDTMEYGVSLYIVA